MVMQISLGGAVGPRDGGLATLGGRPMQQVQPEPVKKTDRAGAPTGGEDAGDDRADQGAAEEADVHPKVDAKDPRSRTPTKGAEIQKGSTVAETGASGEGFGLSSGGGGTGGYLEVANFCCPEYLATMIDSDQPQLELEAGRRRHGADEVRDRA